MIGENARFWIPVAVLCCIAAYSGQKLVRTHLDETIREPNYDFKAEIPSSRGAIYDSSIDGNGDPYPLVKSTPCWTYHLDPVAMTNATVRMKGEKTPRTVKAMARTIADMLKLDYPKVLAMTERTSRRYQFLAVSDNQRAHDVLTNPQYVAGVIAEETNRRRYFEGTRLAHVLGGVNAENNGSSGVEQRFNKLLRGIPGQMTGKRDARGNVLWSKNVVKIEAVPGADVRLTVDHRIQYVVEERLAKGIEEYGAATGWCVVLDAETGKVLALASYPTFYPPDFGHVDESAKLNRVTGFTYEPGSVMKVITAAVAIDDGFVRPDSVYSTDRFEEGYYKLPGDGSHVWNPTMTVEEAIVHSSNIVIGKLGYSFGPLKLYAGMTRFGFGSRTGIELPGEEAGILRDPNKRMWDKATWSRAAIGQGIAVTALQVASAYQALANDGVRVAPRIVESVVDAEGRDLLERPPPESVRVVSVATAREMRRMMLGVAAPGGTARRAAVKGYSVAGKTGTAQKAVGGTYVPGLYRATFCGIVPSGVERRDPDDANPAKPRIVALVTLDFEERTKFHQGGNSSGPIFRDIVAETMRILEVEPDRPDEIEEFGGYPTLVVD